MRKEPAIDSNEMDWIGPWRRRYRGDTRQLGKWIKRKINKRARRKARNAIRQDAQ